MNTRNLNEQLLNVIEDTLYCIDEKSYDDLLPEGGVHELQPAMEVMIKGTKMYETISSLDPSHRPKDISNTSITVENLDTFEKASQPGWREDAICLNMASEYIPGGGVLRGAKAQEEDLCRRSTLLRSLYIFSNNSEEKEILGITEKSKSTYPLKRYGAIYSPSVEVFKSRKYDYLLHPFCTNVITMAAIRNPETKEDGELLSGPKQIIKDKIRSLLRVAGKIGKRKLILGAWGCGAFKNPPRQVAELFKQILGESEFQGWFSDICFAIIDNPYYQDSNYSIFKEVLE